MCLLLFLLQIHIRQHTGEKPFSCKECNFRAADPSVIRKHQMRHYKTDGVPYNCPDCSYASIQSASLKTHLRKYHPNSYHSVICDQCNFVSVSAEIMKRHKQDHRSGILNDEGTYDYRIGLFVH